jgi:hypothetical protein
VAVEGGRAGDVNSDLLLCNSKTRYDFADALGLIDKLSQSSLKKDPLSILSYIASTVKFFISFFINI